MKFSPVIILLSLVTPLLSAEEAAPPTASPLQEVGVDKYGKRATEARQVYEPVVATARLSTAQVCALENLKPLAMATVVSDQGFLLTKASEVVGTKDLVVNFTKNSLAPNGLRLTAKVVDTYRPYDLALLQVAALGLRPAVFSTAAPPALGSFVAAPGLDATPLTYGVLSVQTRSFDEANKGFLGVGLRSSPAGLVIRQVTEKSAASEAGLLANDIVLTINGTAVSTEEDFIRTVSSHKPTEKISLHIKRSDQEQDIDAILRRRGDYVDVSHRNEDPRNSLSGALSEHRSGFPAALQHDLFLKPFECGGPLVNLDGQVIGINIAHSGRTESLAIPSTTILTLLQNVAQGKFYHPELNDLQKSQTNLESELKRLDTLETRIKQDLQDIANKLEALTGKP